MPIQADSTPLHSSLASEASNLSLFKKGATITARLARFRQFSKLGKFDEADTVWKEISAKKLIPSAIAIASHHHAVHHFFRGSLTEEDLQQAEAINGSENALGVRNLTGLRGFWYLDAEDWERAKQSLQQAVALAHKAGKIDRRSEIRLALAKAKLSELDEPEQIAEQFSKNIEDHCHRSLAELWLAIGNREESIRMAKSAFSWACADGEPYTHWYEANKARALLQELGVEVPAVRPYEPGTVTILPVEEKALNAIKELRRLELEFALKHSY